MPRSTKSQARPLKGTLRVPGDKSISHRALILGALATGRSVAAGLNTGEDVQATARALTALGTPLSLDLDNHTAEVEGSGWDGLREPDGVIDAGNSGTTLRLMLGVCSGIEGASVWTGDESLRSRPMLRVVAPLRQMGAHIDGRAYGDRAPLIVRGARLEGLEYRSPVASAQVKGAILLAGLRASGITSVTEPRGSRDHTERLLEALGAPVTVAGNTVTVRAVGQLDPFDLEVPGDFSAAMFFLAAAAAIPGSDLTVEEVGLNPGRIAALDVLRRMGAVVDVAPDGVRAGEPVGSIRVAAADLIGVEVGADQVAYLIDEIPALMVAASQAEGPTVITGAAELRVKESDRIAGLAGGLRSLGVAVEELRDGLIVEGPTRLTGGAVDSLGDHRLAMAFAVAGLMAEGRVKVAGWSCVATSFPDFVERMATLQGRRA